MKRTSDEQVDYLEKLINEYPIDSIEDGMSENDWAGWKKLTDRIGNHCQISRSDLFVTNVEFLSRGIKEGCGNSILIKVKSDRFLDGDTERYRDGSPSWIHDRYFTPFR